MKHIQRAINWLLWPLDVAVAYLTRFNWWVLDRYLLDRLFQPIANRIFEKTGVEPQAIAQFFGIGIVVGIVIRHYFIFGDIVVGRSQLFFNLLLPMMFVVVTLLPFQPSDSGRNIKRWAFFPLRAAVFLFMVYLAFITFNNPLYDYYENVMYMDFNYTLLRDPYWADVSYFGATLSAWVSLCFLSIDHPPPRKFQRAANWNMTG